MIISCDSEGYQSLGRMFFENRWTEYFKTGPNREPVYLLLIAIAMWVGKHLSVSYQPVMMIIQLSILFITQMMTIHILKILKIRDMVSAFTILYIGISPAIVNSAFTLFSEIVTYPFILLIIIVTYYGWLSFSDSRPRTILLAASSGILFCLVTLAKGIFEVITPVFILSILILSLFTFNRKTITNALIYLLVALTVYLIPINAYKFTNKVYNGNFLVTNRGDYRLLGAAIRRTEPLTTQQFLVALACIPGDKFCQSIYGKEKCYYWNFEMVDAPGAEKWYKLTADGLKPGAVTAITYKLAVKQMMVNPLQYAVLCAIEAAKMIFWESTQIGFASYPKFIDKIFNWVLFKNGLRFFATGITFLALIYLISFLLAQRRSLLMVEGPGAKKPEVLLIFSILLIFIFIGTHSLFATLPRYALPIAPLYIIIISFFTDRLLINIH